MCSVVIAFRPDHDWPILVAANRDEMRDRTWLPPARHWPERSHVIAGMDQLAGGSWMGVNDDGVFSCILNRRGSLGPASDKRSRGEVVLDALDYESSEATVEALEHLDPTAYRSFNLIVADFEKAWWVCSDETVSATVRIQELEPGVSMITHADLNERQSARIGKHLPRFQSVPMPEPDHTATDGGDWFGWQGLLADKTRHGDFSTAMNIETDSGFATVSHSLVALPNVVRRPDLKTIWLFAGTDQGYHRVDSL